MSLDKCLGPLLAEGKIDQETHDQALGLFGELQQDLRRQFGEQTADAMASDAALKALDMAATRKRWLAGKTIAARQQMALDLANYKQPGMAGHGGGGQGGGGMRGQINSRAGPAFFAPRQGTRFSSVEGRYQAIRRRALAINAKALQTFHTDALGRVRHAAQLRDLVREIFGHDTGNLAAREMAQAWLKSAEMLRVRFNAAGGQIGELGGGRGYLPQAHDALRVRAATFEQWRDTVLPELDRAAMIDRRTGLAWSDQALELELRKTYDTIRTSGWFDREPGAAMGIGATANRRADPRFLIFKDADSWLRYNEAFGQQNAFGAMLSHIDGMARDTAAMEIFGPNPAAGVEWLRQTIEKSAEMVADDGTALKRARVDLDRMDVLWKQFSGANMRPAREWLANLGSGVRSYETARTLGSAIASAVPGDIGTQFMAARLYKLPFVRVMENQLKMLNPVNGEHRLLANELGLIYEGWTNHAAARMRALAGDELAAGRMGQVAESVLRVTGLGWWTDSGQSAWGMGVHLHMATVRKLGFAQLDPHFRGLLEHGGFTAGEWDAIRATPVTRRAGADWLFAQDIKDPVLGDRVLELLADRKNLAVQEADFETRAIFNDGLKKGTVKGELGRNSLLLKSFGISMLMQHGRQIMGMTSWKSRRAYTARMFITLTLAGAMTIQLRELAKGRDFRDMTRGDFWKQAILQGGGWGMLGDLAGLVADPRVGNFAKYMAGPVADTTESAARVIHDVVISGAGSLGLTDKQVNMGGTFDKALRDQLPGGNIFYTKLALNRLVLDHLRELNDPNYRQAWNLMERQAQKDGTGFWWNPGENMPSRAPDFSNALGAPDDQGSAEQ